MAPYIWKNIGLCPFRGASTMETKSSRSTMKGSIERRRRGNNNSASRAEVYTAARNEHRMRIERCERSVTRNEKLFIFGCELKTNKAFVFASVSSGRRHGAQSIYNYSTYSRQPHKPWPKYQTHLLQHYKRNSCSPSSHSVPWAV